MENHGASKQYVEDVKEFGKDEGLIHEVVVMGRKVGADRKFWATLAHNEQLFREVVDIVNRQVVFKVMVDYTQTPEQMIRAGQYDDVDPDVTGDHFPIIRSGQRKVEIVLFHFSQEYISSDKVTSEINEAGFRYAISSELLALGAQYPKLQEQFTIVTFSPFWKSPEGNRLVLYLCQSNTKRCLWLHTLDRRWSNHWWFAAVRK